MKTKQTKEVTLEYLIDNIGLCRANLSFLLSSYSYVSFIGPHLLFHSTKDEFEGVEEWIAALRSGKYEQGINFLRDDKDKYCCLGVLCDILNLDFSLDYDAYAYSGESKNGLPRDVYFDSPLTDGNGGFNGMFVNGYSGCVSNSLASVNDIGIEFEVIAEVLETLYCEPKK